jgi:uncharacterized protein
MLNFINTTFIPNGIFSIIDENSDLKSLEKYLLFQNKSLLDKNSTLGDDGSGDEFVLICKDFTCTPPITEIESLKGILFGKLSKERIK